MQGNNVFTSGYSGEIDLENETGVLQSNEPFYGADWTGVVQKIITYDEAIGGNQQYSWDVIKQVWFDPNNYNFIIECYKETSGCDIVSPAGFLVAEDTISHPFIMSQSGQFAIGSFITWSTNEIPVLITLESQSGELDPAATSFRSFDGDLDGVPGYAMIANPFPGQTIEFNGFIGSKDGIFVSDLLVLGGGEQECTSVDGIETSASANITVTNDAIDTVKWLLDGELIGNASNINLTLPLGVNQLTVIATAVSGKSATESISVTVRDTISPEIVVEFIDTKSSEVVEVIDRNGLTRLIASYKAIDTCDPLPTVNATGGFSIVNESYLPLKVLNDQIVMDVPDIKVSAVAVDASGNSKASSATLVVK